MQQPHLRPSAQTRACWAKKTQKRPNRHPSSHSCSRAALHAAAFSYPGAFHMTPPRAEGPASV